jgi:DNA-directed RNA polymerase beta subunit
MMMELLQLEHLLDLVIFWSKIISNNTSEQLPESKLLRAIFLEQRKGVKDNSYRMSDGEYGRVIETVTSAEQN